MNNPIRFVFWNLVAVIPFIFPLNLSSQVTIHDPNPNLEYRETIGDPFIPVSKINRLTSPAYNYQTPKIYTYQVNVNDSGLNILGDAANEPSIAIDQLNQNRIFIGWRQFDTIASNFRQAGYGYSLDGGKTWNAPEPIEPGLFRSDPVLDSDADGTIYYNSQNDTFQCHVFKSYSANTTWNQKVFANGGDKAWMIIDKNKRPGIPINNNIYSSWSYYASSCSPTPNSFTRSLDKGMSFEHCTNVPNLPRWGTMAIGLNGELYLCGESRFSITKSFNITDSTQVPKWEFTNNQINLDGRIPDHIGPNPGGLLGQAWIATDLSNGPNKGNVYLLSTVTRKSKADSADVMFARSLDGGITWSNPIQINEDSLENNWNWFGTMSVAPNGRIDVIWLDTRNDPGGFNSQLFYSKSIDGGHSWSKNEAMSNSFNPHLGWPNQNKIGDYYHMVSTNDGAHLAWAATFNGEQDVYYSFIPAESPTYVNNDTNADLFKATLYQNFPNPFGSLTSIRYSLRKQANVKLEILDATLSCSLKSIVDINKIAGDYTATWDGNSNSGVPLPNGIYFYKLSASGEKSIYLKMIMLR